MRILDIRNVPGPNVYSHDPVLAMTLDLEDLAGRESYEIPGFVDRLIERLPGIEEHFCGLGRRGGFIERLRGGTWFGHIVEHVALELTDAAGIPVNRGKTVSTDHPSRFLVAVTYQSEAGMRCLLKTAVELVQALIDDRPFPLEQHIAAAKEAIERGDLGPSTKAIVDSATRRGIPWSRIDENSLVRLGYGKHSKMIAATLSGHTGVIATDIASNKDLTKRILADAGIPVPRGRVVTTQDEAIEAFHNLGAPVVVKPLDGNQGRGVSLNLNTPKEVCEAFGVAQEISRSVLVEQLFRGRDYRVLVINGRLFAASEKTPAHVIGDGEHTISELIAIKNCDPRRGKHHSKPLSCIEADAVVLAYLRRSGRTMDTVPRAGEMMLLRESANLSTGGEAKDVTDIVHPSIARMCERAARAVGLDICGLDIVLPDISQVLSGEGGIIEVNAAPGIRMHQFPAEGQPRDAGGAIVDMLFPNGSNGRIPIVTITGTNGKTTTTRMIGHVLQHAGKTVGMTTTDGIWIGGGEIARGDMTGPWSARVVLSDTTVDAAVLETARGGIVRGGLGYDWSDVAVLTNIQADHIGQDGIESVDDIYRIKRLTAERVREGGTLVLNADDERLADLPQDPKVSRVERRVVYFSLDPNNLLIQRHTASGGTAYVLHGDWIEERVGQFARRIARASDLPCTFHGTAAFQIANVLAAVAACRSLGVAHDSTAAALSMFDNGEMNSGRMNVYEFGGGMVLLDYGHNPHAIVSLAGMLERWPASRVTAVFGLPGDRTDDLLAESARIAARSFQQLIIREDEDRRGRKRGELAALIERAAKAECARCDTEVVLDELEAVRSALGRIMDGEVVVCLCDRTDDVAAEVSAAGGMKVSDFRAAFEGMRHRLRIPA